MKRLAKLRFAYSILLSSLLLLTLLLTACASTNVELSVNRNGSSYLNIDITTDDSLYTFLEFAGGISLLTSWAEEQGLSLRQKADGNGFRLERDFASPEELAVWLQPIVAVSAHEQTPLHTKRGLLFDLYVLNVAIDVPNYLEQHLTAWQAELLKPITNQFKLGFTLHLPVKPIEHNASAESTDGRTLTWQLEGGQTNLLQAVVRVPRVGNILLLAFALLLSLLLIIRRIRASQRRF